LAAEASPEGVLASDASTPASAGESAGKTSTDCESGPDERGGEFPAEKNEEDSAGEDVFWVKAERVLEIAEVEFVVPDGAGAFSSSELDPGDVIAEKGCLTISHIALP
jgi:hypothetical protein